MTATLTQLLSVAALVAECEDICSADALKEVRRETRLRKCTAQVLAQFHMPSMHERAGEYPHDLPRDYDRLVAKTARDLIVGNVIHLTPREVK